MIDNTLHKHISAKLIKIFCSADKPIVWYVDCVDLELGFKGSIQQSYKKIWIDPGMDNVMHFCIYISKAAEEGGYESRIRHRLS